MSNENEKVENVLLSPAWSLGLGIASILLWEFSIVPIAAIATGVYAYTHLEPHHPEKYRWQAGIGFVLGVLFVLVRLAN